MSTTTITTTTLDALRAEVTRCREAEADAYDASAAAASFNGDLHEAWSRAHGERVRAEARATSAEYALLDQQTYLHGPASRAYRPCIGWHVYADHHGQWWIRAERWRGRAIGSLIGTWWGGYSLREAWRAARRLSRLGRSVWAGYTPGSASLLIARSDRRAADAA